MPPPKTRAGKKTTSPSTTPNSKTSAMTEKRPVGRPRKVPLNMVPSPSVNRQPPPPPHTSLGKRDRVVHDSEMEDNHPQPTKREKRVVVPRSPLPERVNRVSNPGAPDVPRAKRTSAEVQAAEARRQELILEMEELDKKKIQMLAELNVEQDMEDEEEERTLVRFQFPHKRPDSGEEDVEMADEPEYPIAEDDAPFEASDREEAGGRKGAKIVRKPKVG